LKYALCKIKFNSGNDELLVRSNKTWALLTNIANKNKSLYWHKLETLGKTLETATYNKIYPRISLPY